MIDISFFVGLGSATFVMATPILFAATGEIYGERAGVLNLGIEGLMAAGAFLSLWTALITGSLWIGVLAAIFSCILLTAFMAFLVIKFNINQIISGLLLVMLGEGISLFGYKMFYSDMLVGINTFNPILFGQNILVYLALISAFVAGIILFKTTLGLKIRGVGENPRAADSLGIDVYRTRYLSVLFGGGMAGLAGASLTLGTIGLFSGGMVAGRGWIAIIVVILSRWNPFIAIGGSLLFGLSYALGANLMASGVPIPYHFLLMLPYISAMIAIGLVFKRARGPASLLLPYRRE